MSLPYENSTAGGEKALGEIQKILRHFGCTRFGSMTDDEKQEILIQFSYRGQDVSVRASINGYAAAWLREHPYTSRMKKTKAEHERAAREQASIAVYSMLRDYIKAQVTIVETGILSFEAAFLGQILLDNGQTVHEVAREQRLLPEPESAE